MPLSSSEPAGISPTGGRPRGTIREWFGESVGHREEETLVVETINFADETAGFVMEQHLQRADGNDADCRAVHPGRCRHARTQACAMGGVAALLMAGGITVAGQSAARVSAVSDGPRTQWGAPDLQGSWSQTTVTPFERPSEFAGREFLTDEERGCGAAPCAAGQHAGSQPGHPRRARNGAGRCRRLQRRVGTGSTDKGRPPHIHSDRSARRTDPGQDG